MKVHHKSLQQHAMTASQTMRDHFSWRHAAEQAVDSLQSLGFFQWQNIFGDRSANRVQSMVAS
jgi:hypothetical protein